MAQFKISEYPAKTVFNDGDLYDVSTYDGVSAYTSEKLTFAQLKAELNSVLNFVSDNLYTANGTLLGNRTVTQGGFDLRFEAGSNDFYVNGATANTLFVDGSASNVGIGTATPSQKLEINGNLLLSGSRILKFSTLADVTSFNNGGLQLQGNGSTNLLHFTDTGATKMFVGQTKGMFTNIGGDADSLGLRNDVGNIHFGFSNNSVMTLLSSGNLGIGLTTPSEKLHVNGNARVDGNLILNNGLTNLGYTSSAAAPTTTELPTDKDYSIHKDTVGGTVYLAYNDGGVIKTVTLT